MSHRATGQTAPLLRADRPPRRSRGGFGTWLRYHWHHLFLHAVLIFFGLINLYPFFWMVGTSLKAEEEASNRRMRPYPIAKYKLAGGFKLEDVLPVALEPGLATAEGERRKDLLNRLRNKLEVLHVLQRDALPLNVRHKIGRLAAERDEGYQALEERVERLEARLKELERDEAPRETPEHAHVRKALSAARGEAAEGLKRLVKTTLDRLVKAGVMEQRAEGDTYWLSAGAFEGELPPGLGPRETAVAKLLVPYYTVTPKRYSTVTAQSLADSQEQLKELAFGSGAVLVPVPAAEEEAAGPGEAPAYRLAEGARGRLYKDLYPRQVLTLWALRQENIRRSESRSTYATDRRSFEQYQKEHGLPTWDRARREVKELRRAGHLVPGRFQFINYWVVLKEENFLLHFMTSLLVTGCVVSGSVLMASMLGYAIARMSFPGRWLVLGVLISASILPQEARMVPVFKMLTTLGGTENLWGMIVWLLSGGVGHTLIMAGFFLSLPKEVDEAAEVDGAGPFRKFFDVALPMARPVVMTVALFSFIGAWNNFMVPLLCTMSRPSMQPLVVAVVNFQRGHEGKWHQINAAAAVMIVPVIILFLLVQKHIVKAIAVGHLKG